MTKLLPIALLTVLAAGCASEGGADAQTDDSDLKLKGVTAEERAQYVAHAQVWLDGDPAKIRARSPAELLAGPKAEDAFAFEQEVACDFVEPDDSDKLGGLTPKFQCKLPSGDVVKVKYSRDTKQNREVFAEVIATRMMWSIGLAADRMYPVKVTCNGCPEEPWAAYVQKYGTTFNKLRYRDPGARGTRRFELAVIERKFAGGAKIEAPSGSAGFSFEELPRHPASYWDQNAAERRTYDEAHPELEQLDALRLWAAWAKHADNKIDNQRLVCANDGVTANGKCTRPILMIQDMGVSFGGGTELGGLKYEAGAKASLDSWKNQAKSPTWKNFSKCQASLGGSLWSGTLDDPHVSEPGRRYLATRLGALTDEQLTAIFQAARIERSDNVVLDGLTGQNRPATVADWVRGFVWMRDIISKPCPIK